MHRLMWVYNQFWLSTLNILLNIVSLLKLYWSCQYVSLYHLSPSYGQDEVHSEYHNEDWCSHLLISGASFERGSNYTTDTHSGRKNPENISLWSFNFSFFPLNTILDHDTEKGVFYSRWFWWNYPNKDKHYKIFVSHMALFQKYCRMPQIAEFKMNIFLF